MGPQRPAGALTAVAVSEGRAPELRLLAKAAEGGWRAAGAVVSRGKKFGRGASERYLRLGYWFLNSPAWSSLRVGPRALYLEMAKRYNGRNNGRISYSVREGAAALHVSKGSVKNWLDVLQGRGFIACTRRGAFSLKTTRDASEWRLTEYDCDTPSQHATKEFMRWTPPEPEENAAPKSKTRFSQRTRTVQPQVPYGSATDTVKSKKGPNGSATGTVKPQNNPPTVQPQVHLQLPGIGSWQEYHGVGRGEYVLSDDPRDFEQFGTTEYRGRPFLVIDNVPKRRGPPPSALRLRARMIFVTSAAPLSIGDLARQLGIARIDANTLAQTMLKAGEIKRHARGTYSWAAKAKAA